MLERIGSRVTATYNRRRVVISTVNIDGVYETMCLLESTGDDLECIRTPDREQAEKNHVALVEKYTEHETPLSGKYLKLAEDLKRIHTEAVAACAEIADGGTCNMDAPAIRLPHWRAGLVEKAAEAAGTGCSEWRLYKNKYFVFSPRINGQAYRRERCARYMTQALKSAGYDAFLYSQMD